MRKQQQQQKRVACSEREAGGAARGTRACNLSKGVVVQTGWCKSSFLMSYVGADTPLLDTPYHCQSTPPQDPRVAGIDRHAGGEDIAQFGIVWCWLDEDGDGLPGFVVTQLEFVFSQLTPLCVVSSHSCSQTMEGVEKDHGSGNGLYAGMASSRTDVLIYLQQHGLPGST